MERRSAFSGGSIINDLQDTRSGPTVRSRLDTRHLGGSWVASIPLAAAAGGLSGRLWVPTHAALFVVGEISYLAASQDRAVLFFQSINRRREQASTELTSNTRLAPPARGARSATRTEDKGNRRVERPGFGYSLAESGELGIRYPTPRIVTT